MQIISNTSLVDSAAVSLKWFIPSLFFIAYYDSKQL